MKTETITVKELIKMLSDVPEHYKVYIGKDSEGNSFGTLDDVVTNFLYSREDDVLMILPFADGLEYEDIAPKSVEGYKNEQK